MSLDAGLRMDGIPSLDLWDLVIEVFHSSPNQLINKCQVHENLSRKIIQAHPKQNQDSNSARKFMESCIIHFPTTPTCSTTVELLETGDIPIMYSLPQTMNLGITIELVPQVDKTTCPPFRLFSSPAKFSTVGHMVLDLTSLTYQPSTESIEYSIWSPKDTCNLCHVRANTELARSHTHGQLGSSQAFGSPCLNTRHFGSGPRG